MRTAALVVSAVLAVGAVGAVWANHCHDTGDHPGCNMEGCPGAGLTMQTLSGTVTEIAAKHDLIKVKKGERTLTLRVHSDCPNKEQLKRQVAKLKVGQALKATYYTRDGKTYLCQIGEKKSCH